MEFWGILAIFIVIIAIIIIVVNIYERKRTESLLAIAEKLDSRKFKLPQYVSLSRKDGKAQLIYDKRTNNKRYNMKSTIKEFDETKLEEYVSGFLEKVGVKYVELS